MPGGSPRRIGKYEIESELGRGGFSRVYKAFDPTVNRPVAIKVLNALDGALITRFQNEAKATGNLRHPNIVTIYEFGMEEDTPYLVMEYLEGQDLQQVIAGSPQLSLFDKVRIMVLVAQGLQCAHRNGVIHRDVKPSNIRVLPTGQVKVMDFGIARLVHQSSGRLTQSGFLIGTIKYMSPEQFKGAEADAQCDIFTYGLVFYEFLSGKNPFEADEPRLTMYRLISERPAPLSETVPGCPSALEQIVLRALEKDRELRYQSFDDLLLDLQPVLLNLQSARAQELLVEARRLVDSGQILESEPVVKSILDLDPANPDAKNLIGHVQQTLRQMSVKSLVEARLKGIDNQIAQRLLEEAGASLDVALKMYPNEPELTKRLEELRRLREQMSRVRQPDLGSPSRPGDDVKQPNAGATILVDSKSIAKSFPLPVESGGQHHRELTEYFGQPEFDQPLRAGLTILSCADSFREGETVPIRASPFTIGRIDSDLLISEDSTLSRRHAAIVKSGSGFNITDLGSSNGTYLNGRRLHPNQDEPLPLNAEIRLSGTTRLRFRCDISELPDFTGQKLSGRYTLERRLRTGRKSALYEGTDSRPVRKVAVKLLSPTLASYPGYLEQFEQEAETAAGLDHPHICKIYEYGCAPLAFSPGQTKSLHYLCMQFFDGGSLDIRLDAAEHTTPSAVGNWLDVVSNALSHAHKNGVVHAGLKPTSIVFTATGVPYVADFAIAIRPKGTARTQPKLGAPDYLAPEQWDGLIAQPETDQYSLAAVCYRVLTGAVPFENQLDPQVRNRNFDQGALPANIRAKSLKRPPVTQSISDVLSRALSVNPPDRFSEISDFAAAFRSCLGEIPLPNRKPRVFVSYRREADAGWAALFAEKLGAQHGLDVFVDRHRVDSARQVPEKIQSAIRDCDFFVCLLSSSTLQSKWVREEIRLADAAGKPMIPVVHEGFRRPGKWPASSWLRRLVPNAWQFPECERRLLDSEEVRLFADFDEAAIEKIAKMILFSSRNKT